jgi:hypothetical protein
VVEEAVVEGHVSFGNVHRNLLDHGAVSLRVTVQEIVAPHILRITDRPGGAVPMPPAVASVHHGDRARLLGAVVERNEGGEHFVRRAGGPEILVEVPGDNVRLLFGDGRLVDQCGLEDAYSRSLCQAGGHRPDDGFPQDFPHRFVLVVDVVVVALDISVGGGPVGQSVRPFRKLPIALTSVVALARVGQGVHFGVGEQLLRQIPATLRIKPDIFLGREQFDFLGGKS